MKYFKIVFDGTPRIKYVEEHRSAGAAHYRLEIEVNGVPLDLHYLAEYLDDNIFRNEPDSLYGWSFSFLEGALSDPEYHVVFKKYPYSLWHPDKYEGKVIIETLRS